MFFKDSLVRKCRTVFTFVQEGIEEGKIREKRGWVTLIIHRNYGGNGEAHELRINRKDHFDSVGFRKVI